jgi:hypothetical protein
MLSVGDRVTDDIFEENLKDATGLLIDESRDALNTATASKTTDGWLGDALDIVAKHLSMTLGASLSETFASFTTAGHDVLD